MHSISWVNWILLHLWELLPHEYVLVKELSIGLFKASNILLDHFVFPRPRIVGINLLHRELGIIFPAHFKELENIYVNTIEVDLVLNVYQFLLCYQVWSRLRWREISSLRLRDTIFKLWSLLFDQVVNLLVNLEALDCLVLSHHLNEQVWIVV